jgi:hypothetical protein
LREVGYTRGQTEGRCMVDTTPPGVYPGIYPGVDTMHCGDARRSKEKSSPSLLEGKKVCIVVDTIPRVVDTWVDTWVDTCEEGIYHRAPRQDRARAPVVDTGRYLHQYYACRGWWRGDGGQWRTTETPYRREGLPVSTTQSCWVGAAASLDDRTTPDARLRTPSQRRVGACVPKHTDKGALAWQDKPKQSELLPTATKRCRRRGTARGAGGAHCERSKRGEGNPSAGDLLRHDPIRTKVPEASAAGHGGLLVT